VLLYRSLVSTDQYLCRVLAVCQCACAVFTHNVCLIEHAAYASVGARQYGLTVGVKIYRGIPAGTVIFTSILFVWEFIHPAVGRRLQPI